LPWRRTRDPYAIWISEIMLQQTQVVTVIPYWHRWLRTLPDILTLAKTQPSQVLKLWAGLGYYSRARNLQKAAREILRNHNGQLPGDTKDLQALPGIGRYTAGAICSIAFNQPEPILDGNATRVLTRLFAIGENPRSTDTARRLWALAEEFVATTTEHGALNQALMELGATRCLPRNPLCTECPLKLSCRAFQLGKPEAYPHGTKRPKMLKRHWRVLAVEDGGDFLMRQRSTGQLNAGLWEFPTMESNNGRAPASWATTLVGSPMKRPRQLATLSHSITRYRIRIKVWKADLRGPRPEGRWVAQSLLDKLPLTGAHRKVLAALRAAE
jgi:A/G-specific adenine glycosylase